MKLYDRQGTPNAARVRIVLAAKGLDEVVEIVQVDLVAAEQKQDWFLAMNPIGKTPVLLLDDGLALSESPAITEYLDNLDGNPVLTGRTPREKGLIHMMQRRVEIMLLDPVDDYFHYGTRGLGEALRPWRMPEWDAAEKKAWGERRGALAVANLPYFDGALRERPFLAGDFFSLADISLWAGLVFLTGAGLPIAPELTALAAWKAKVDDLPAVRNRTGQNF
ncbi:glutathione S-transferase family protein [Sphingobium nicotianae]|uniref:Glutathione S-transferase family protein n=1 Tax=Sphingobium nicotianae TaxID=2782607 RepID=A0A9X1IPK3_9SPHN|nr:glutathione S-transferase family protein [Sphingobium nicotianae]MBT2186208.1 glutathione S-transferase family protein [Sphingobium nicotianae]